MAASQTSKIEMIVWWFVRFNYETKPNCQNVPAALKYLIKVFSKQIFGSNMLTNKEDLDFIQALSTTKLPNIFKSKIKLLYTASENNYLSSKFHESCDGHGPTLTIIKNNFGNIFGGYTTVKWQSPTWNPGDKTTWESDEKAFLFLIRSNDAKLQCPKVYDIINSSNAVRHEDTLGPIFGGGYDMVISDRCNLPMATTSGHELMKYGIYAYSSCFRGPYTYNYVENELCGSNVNYNNLFFYQVLEYQVFEIQ